MSGNESASCSGVTSPLAQLSADHRQLMAESDEEVLPENSTMADFLAYHLQGEYGKDQVADWGYNILAACEKHIYDADIELFYLCLMGAVSEFVHDDSVKLMTSFHELVTKIDLQNAKQQHYVGATVSILYYSIA